MFGLIEHKIGSGKQVFHRDYSHVVEMQPTGDGSMFTCSKCGERRYDSQRDKGNRCYDCCRAYERWWSEQNPGYYTAFQRKWIAANPDKRREYEARYLSDPEKKAKKLAARRGRYQKNREYELQRAKDDIARQRVLKLARHTERYKTDPEYAKLCKAHANVTRGKRRYARNSPLADHYRARILEIYLKCPPSHEVDHIEPLIGKVNGVHVASGLHAPWNLHYLTPEENRRKGCKLEV
jgi:hypothetical protein